MDEVLARKLSRQLRFLNVFLVLFLIVFLTVFAVASVFAYRAAQEVREAKDSLTSVQQQASDTLDVRDELCTDSGSVTALLKSQSDVCN